MRVLELKVPPPIVAVVNRGTDVVCLTVPTALHLRISGQ